jgi:hypothetical protein
MNLNAAQDFWNTRLRLIWASCKSEAGPKSVANERDGITLVVIVHPFPTMALFTSAFG